MALATFKAGTPDLVISVLPNPHHIQPSLLTLTDINFHLTVIYWLKTAVVWESILQWISHLCPRGSHVSAEGQASRAAHNSSHQTFFCHLMSVKITGSNPSIIGGIHTVLEKYSTLFSPQLQFKKKESLLLVVQKATVGISCLYCLFSRFKILPHFCVTHSPLSEWKRICKLES